MNYSKICDSKNYFYVLSLWFLCYIFLVLPTTVSFILVVMFVGPKMALCNVSLTELPNCFDCFLWSTRLQTVLVPYLKKKNG